MSSLVRISLVLFTSFYTQHLAAVDDYTWLTDPDNAYNTDRINYINRFKSIAIEEMERTGIPASIKLAQGVLESGDGKSELATRANNHFGIKCGGSWEGGTYYVKDDDYDANGNLIKSCFRQYKDAENSYRAHSDFLTDPRKDYRYGPLFQLDPKDYKAWARGLRKAGYATNPRYATLLISIIEANNLHQYDLQSTLDYEDGPLAVEETRNQVLFVNDVKMVFAEQYETPRDIARKYGVKAERIADYNEIDNPELAIFEAGQRIFLQPKRTRYRGKREWHIVKGNETMYHIAQRYGLRTATLYVKNRLQPGQQPATGERIKLRGTVDDDEVPRTRPATEQDDQREFGRSLAKWLRDLGSGTYVPTPAPPPPPPAPAPEPPTPVDDDTADDYEVEEIYYYVQPGDYLIKIARKFDTTVEAIMRLNKLEDTALKVGQQLRVR